MWEPKFNQIVSGDVPPPDRWPRSQEEWRLQHDRYAIGLDNPLPSAEHLTLSSTAKRKQQLQQQEELEKLMKEKGVLMVTSFMYGNVTAIANDPLPNPAAYPSRCMFQLC
jgi:hypothetical protein